MDKQALELADTVGAGLLVVPNRTGDAFERILLGDEIESIVRHAHCPVLVVRSPD
jgi:nucleotide-binding universal stress UspA family protein